MKIIKSNIFICDKCGKTIEYEEGSIVEESCWIFTPNHYRAGYGSSLDGCEFTLDLCDNCLYNFVETFKHKNRIYSTGSNWEPEDE